VLDSFEGFGSVSLLSLQVVPLFGPGDCTPVLACSDRSIRVLTPEKKVMFEVSTPSPPTALLFTPDSHDPQHKFPAAAKQVLYGCEDGRVVQLMVDSGAVRQGFTIPAPAQAGAVRCLYSGADYSKVSMFMLQ
jgi:hypothetical protein